MSYLIILFVIALALAPLSHFIPSKKQKKVARLREYAALNGLYVEFRDPPDSPKIAAVRSGAAQIIYYGKRVSSRGRGPEQRIAWVRDDEGWHGLPRRQSVPEPLSILPPVVFAASADPDSCGVYWLEAGDEAEIDQILIALAALADTLYQ